MTAGVPWIVPLDTRGPIVPSWPGCSARGSVILPLDPAAFAGVPPELVLPDVRLQRKAEFHLTLLNRAETAALAAQRPPATWAARFEALDWAWQPTGERWLLRDDSSPGPARWSVVERLLVPALAAFRTALAEEANILLPTMPAHVTLLVAGIPEGIGLPSEAALAAAQVRRLA